MPINKITHVCLTHDKVRARNEKMLEDLAIFLNDIHSGAKGFPSNNMSWCDWLNKPDDGHLLDRKS